MMRCILRPGDEIVDGRAARRPGGRVTGRESRDTAGFVIGCQYGVNTGRAEQAPVVTTLAGLSSSVVVLWTIGGARAMASSRGILNIQSLDELTSENVRYPFTLYSVLLLFGPVLHCHVSFPCTALCTFVSPHKCGKGRVLACGRVEGSSRPKRGRAVRCGGRSPRG